MSEIIYVCLACGKTANDQFGKNASPGWDESCMINCRPVQHKNIEFNEHGRVVTVLEIDEARYLQDCENLKKMWEEEKAKMPKERRERLERMSQMFKEELQSVFK